MNNQPLILLTIVLYLTSPNECKPSQSALDLAKEWSPMVWLHSMDKFYPSDVTYFLENVEVRDEKEGVIMKSVNMENIPTGGETGGYHLNTHEDLKCVDCVEDFFFGQDLEQVTTYTMIKEFNDDCETIDINYPFFYPYNFGKKICIGIDPDGNCLGFKKMFGNHVGDWENTIMRFQNGKPVAISIGAHSFSAKYAWNEDDKRFDFYYGSPLNTFSEADEVNEEIDVAIEYPKHVFLEEDNHVALFSANGSHGMWATEGKHTYFNLIIHMEDYTDKGVKWDVGANMKPWDVQDQNLGPEFKFTGFHGIWGNIQKIHCELESISGECGLGSGPSGPGRSWGMGAFEATPKCGNIHP